MVRAGVQGLNEEPKQWAQHFWAGEPDYQSDQKWWEAAIVADELRNRTAPVKEDQEPPVFDDDEPDDDESPETENQLGFEEDSSLTQTYELPEISGAPSLDVTARRLVVGSLPRGLHIDFAATGRRVETVLQSAP